MSRRCKKTPEKDSAPQQLALLRGRHPRKGNVMSDISRTNKEPNWVKKPVFADMHEISLATVSRWINTGVVDARRHGPRLVYVDANSLRPEKI
jgi:hypothetical protein